jgi:hypothetical protein
MTEGDQDQSGVAVAVSSLPRLFRQLLDFGRRQILPRPQLGIPRPDRRGAAWRHGN